MVSKKFLNTLIIFITALSTAYGYADADSIRKKNTKNILILNSYHQGYKWTDDEIRGIIAALEPLNRNTHFYIEYMGTKWNYDSSYFQQLKILYKQKYNSIKFDIIFATDDDAFNFLKLNRDLLFGRVPVVFSGINWITPERLDGLNGYTGVNEDVDITLNIELILKIHPDTRNIYVIMDATTTGDAIFKKFSEIIPQYKSRVNIDLLYNYRMPELLEKLTTLYEGSIVILTVFQKDKSGDFYEYSDSCRLISESSRFPVYGLWDFNLGSGMTGGNLASGYSQGLTAGETGLKILKGMPAEAVPVVMKSPNYYMFDYKQLAKHNINMSILPPESVIINRPSAFYSINKQLFAVLAGVFAVLSVSVIILVMNIRRRNTAEKALRKSEEKYRSLVNNLNHGVFRSTTDPGGKLLQANPAMMKIYGYDSIDEFMKISITDLYQEPSDIKLFMDNVIEKKSVRDVELKMRRKDNTPILVSVSASAVMNESGIEISWIDGIVEDITEKRKIEQELRYAQKMETIGTLASGLVHDFNNSLGGVVGILSIIQHKIHAGLVIKDDKLKQYLAIMKESLDKGAAMVQRLLTIARKRDEEHRPADLNEIVKRVIELLSGYIDKTIIISVNYYDEKAVVMADSAQLEQSLLNLCINAGHAMTIMRNSRDLWGGTLTLSIEKMSADKYVCEVHPEAEEKDYWIISVSDTGIGMMPDTAARIFDPFFTTKEEGTGTGLGLLIVNGAIKDHGGFIDLYSEAGTGTTFKLYLPVSSAKHEKTGESLSCEIPYGKGLILVVDDEPVLRETAMEILSECGYEVITADNGYAALEIFKSRPDEITAVVLDIAMPVMSGFVAYKEMLKIDSEVKVLVTSGFKQDKRIGEILSIGSCGFLEKPYTLEKLGTAVREIIMKR